MKTIFILLITLALILATLHVDAKKSEQNLGRKLIVTGKDVKEDGNTQKRSEREEDDTNESFGNYAHGSRSSTETHHHFIDDRRPGKG